MKRRQALGGLIATPALVSIGVRFPREEVQKRVQFSVNAFSFNELLRSGKMNFDDMMEYAADIGLNAVDLTGYYFNSYPQIPPDTELFRLKRKALTLGLNISWTGVRNNFCQPDPALRNQDLELINKWLRVSSKLGAAIMRIFAGRGEHPGHSRKEVKEWMAADLKHCASLAEKAGVIAGLQHHNDFLFKADEVIEMLEMVDSKWLGLILDCGSLDDPDPYAEIAKLAPYADYWFVKEHVMQFGKRVPVDMQKITNIVKQQNYQGYISLESLSEGDPREIVQEMLLSFKQAYNA